MVIISLLKILKGFDREDSKAAGCLFGAVLGDPESLKYLLSESEKSNASEISSYPTSLQTRLDFNRARMLAHACVWGFVCLFVAIASFTGSFVLAFSSSNLLPTVLSNFTPYRNRWRTPPYYVGCSNLP